MGEGITSTSSYVEYIHPPDIEWKYLDDVPTIPLKAEQASPTPIIENATDSLFDFELPSPFATFAPPHDVKLKRLFQRQVLSGLNTDQSIEILDKLEESATVEKVIEMLYSLDDLNNLLETIYYKIFSTLKP